MPIHNSDIANIFTDMGDLLEIQGANPFRVRAYRNAARVVGNWPIDLAERLRQGDSLPKMPGLGNDLRGKLAEIAQTGQLAAFETLKKEIPEGLLELLRLPGLGPKRVRLLQWKLGICSSNDLQAAIREGRLKELPGFGQTLINKFAEALAKRGTERDRLPLAAAEQIALPILKYLMSSQGVLEAALAGSFRRRSETVGDLDFVVGATENSNVMERFLKYEDVAEVLERGKTRATVRLRDGLQVDLRVVSERSYGAALHYFTGSKAHNIAVRRLGLAKGLKINEYGVFRKEKWLQGRTEAEVFASVNLPYIEPELRENRGEIETAQLGELPHLVSPSEIRGDLHVHTNATDGRMTLEEMAAAATALGYEYIAITDHSRHLTVAKGLTPTRLKNQLRKIDAFNQKNPGIHVLKSIEVDILEDGSLDLPNDVLCLLDLVVGAIHSKFDLPEKKQTERILRAMDNPYFHILAHPTGRLRGTRSPSVMDFERVVQGAKERGCFLELNAQPDRMDLNDAQCRYAKEIGVKVAISTDAHSENDFRNMAFGLSQARRGWLEKNDVLNTLSLAQLKRLLRRKH